MFINILFVDSHLFMAPFWYIKNITTASIDVYSIKQSYWLTNAYFCFVDCVLYVPHPKIFSVLRWEDGIFDVFLWIVNYGFRLVILVSQTGFGPDLLWSAATCVFFSRNIICMLMFKRLLWDLSDILSFLPPDAWHHMHQHIVQNQRNYTSLPLWCL